MARIGRDRIAELTAPAGAWIVAIGIGSLATSVLDGIEPMLMVGGFSLHAWGMAEKHRLERQHLPWWASVYFVCWLVLVALVCARAYV